jgi:hypothetical protein
VALILGYPLEYTHTPKELLLNCRW